MDSPIVAAMGMDADAGYVAEAATELARRLKRPILPVFAQSTFVPVTAPALEADAQEIREDILAFFGPAIDAGVEVAEPLIAQANPAEFLLEVAARNHAHMIVLGPGRPSTVVQWLLGSTAYNIVRNAAQPVFLARGTLPTFDRRIVCPMDLSPQSGLGLSAALRMSRAFNASLRIVHVLPSDRRLRLTATQVQHKADEAEQAEAKIREMLDAHHAEGVEVEIQVLRGRPSTTIVENSLDAQLLVLASREFRWLLPGTFGSTTEKVLRGVRCSVLTVRDSDINRDEREERLDRIAKLRNEAREALETEPARAVELARLACLYAPMNAGLQELLADAYAKLGQPEFAEDARALAARIRADFQ